MARIGKEIDSGVDTLQLDIGDLFTEDELILPFLLVLRLLQFLRQLGLEET